MREHHNFIFQCYLQSPNFRVERKSSMLYMSVRKVPPSYDYGKYMQDILNKQRDWPKFYLKIDGYIQNYTTFAAAKVWVRSESPTKSLPCINDCGN